MKSDLNCMLGYFLSFHKRIIDETNLDTMSFWNTNRNQETEILSTIVLWIKLMHENVKKKNDYFYLKKKKACN